MLDAHAGRHETIVRPTSWRGRRVSPRVALPLLLMLAWVSAPGCREQVNLADREVITAATKQPEQDHFDAALDFLKMRNEHNLDRSASQASYHLNRWIRDETADPRWMIDRPILNTLPDVIRRAPATKEILSDKSLAQLEFLPGDVLFLEESRWLHAIAKTAAASEPAPAFARWLAEAGLEPKAAKKLAIAEAVFDWTVRNIQLDELLPYPKSSAAGPVAGAENDERASWPPPMLGLPGPGYTGDPWHVLLYGHGDSYQRASVFILLLRQMRIDAAMLAIDSKTGRAQPWLPAVLIENQLYLFDAELGLPLPGPAGKGVATLAQVIADSAILEALHIGENYTYRVSQADLDKVVALLDASPESLSQRMRLVEQNLGAEDQMTLTVASAELQREFRACQGIQDVRLWEVPIETVIYQQAYRMLLSRDTELQWKDFLEHGVFNELTPVVKGRRRYLLGQFNNQGDEPGATSYFLAARMADSALEDLASKRAQAAMGLERPRGMSEAVWNGRIEQVKRLQIEAKQHASYWLGLTHVQQRNDQVAANWFKTRTLESYPDGPWTHGARYNLARCYESMGKTDEAKRLYMIDESPQRYGNLLRAQSLEGEAATKQPAEAAAPAASAPGNDATQPPGSEKKSPPPNALRDPAQDSQSK